MITYEGVHDGHTNRDLVAKAEQEGNQKGDPDREGLLRLCCPDGEGEQQDVDDDAENEAAAAADGGTHLDGCPGGDDKFRELLRVI